MSWFKRIFGKDGDQPAKVTPTVMRHRNLDYSPKIIIAWCQALEGNTDIASWLLNNGFEELFYTTQAIFLKQQARDWLMKNGYPHMMALVNAAEGNESALRWLEVHNFDTLYHLANAVEGEMDSFAWLKHHSTEDLFLLATTIKKVKDRIEFNHNDMYSFGKDI